MDRCGAEWKSKNILIHSLVAGVASLWSSAAHTLCSLACVWWCVGGWVDGAVGEWGRSGGEACNVHASTLDAHPPTHPPYPQQFMATAQARQHQQQYHGTTRPARR